MAIAVFSDLILFIIGIVMVCVVRFSSSLDSFVFSLLIRNVMLLCKLLLYRLHSVRRLVVSNVLGNVLVMLVRFWCLWTFSAKCLFIVVRIVTGKQIGRAHV